MSDNKNISAKIGIAEETGSTPVLAVDVSDISQDERPKVGDVSLLPFAFKVPREFISRFSWEEYPHLFLYLRARHYARNRGGYFRKNILGRSYKSRTTFKRHFEMAMAAGLIVHVKDDIYRVVSLYRLQGKRRRGHYGLPQTALFSLKHFKAALIACEASYMVANQREQYDKLQKLTPQAREALVKLRSFKRGLALAKAEKKGRPLATRLFYDDLNLQLGDGTSSLPKEMRRLLYQFLPDDKTNVGYVGVHALADYFGISQDTASKYRWRAKVYGYLNVELSAIELEPMEYMRPYVLRNRVFRKDGKVFYRMTSRITSFVHTDKRRSNIKHDKKHYYPLYSMI